jgi:hypothetical protein
MIEELKRMDLLYETEKAQNQRVISEVCSKIERVSEASS